MSDQGGRLLKARSKSSPTRGLDMRYREKVNSTEYDTYRKYVYDSEGYPGWDVDIEVEYLSCQSYVAMLDVITPNWKRLISEGKILNNPLLQISNITTFRPVLFTAEGYQDSDCVRICHMESGSSLPATLPTSLDWNYWNDYTLDAYSDDRDIALGKAWAGVDISEMQVLASLGEMPETVRWMTSLVGRMLGIIRAFTAKKLSIEASKFFRSGKSMIDAMSELWLEFRYAVRPLVYDMHQAVSALKHVVDKSLRFTSRGYHRSSTIETSTYVASVEGSFESIVSRKRETKADFRAGVLYSIDSDINGLMSVWGLDRPFEMIWELTPFSFIIDWFFSVGDVLQSWTFNPGLNPLASWITEQITEITTDSATGVAVKDDASNYRFTTGFISAELTQAGSTVQSVVTKRRIPSPQRSILPHFNLNLNTAKIIDLTSIGRDLFNVFSQKK
jgi:hypothetical protein